MRFSIILGALMAVVVSAAPAPCNEYTCQKIPPPGTPGRDLSSADVAADVAI
ncbi:hypothetical protein LZ32DRAFT_655972 [Colletotrichum eremochloae]|nr:hypothetical protein LZ32DRAFT_655972 [Colletotrichum eremochloae]